MSLFSEVSPSITETLKGVVEEKAPAEVLQEKGVMSTDTPPKEEESFAVKYAMDIVGRDSRVLEPVQKKPRSYKVELPEVDDLEVEAYLKRIEIEQGPITPPTTMGEMAGATASDVATERNEAGITQSRTKPASVYKIKKGDNLSKIARANNTTVDAILELNDIENPDIIVEGERLIMPDPMSPTANIETAGVMSRPEPVEVPTFKSYNSPEEMSDLEILARTIEAEARGEPYKGKVAVGATIANRVASGSYGGKGGIKGVILKKGQFSPWNSYTGYAEGKQGKDMLNLKASEDSYKAAKAILTGNYTDPTNGATHYVNESIAEGQSWIDTMKAREKGTVTIGNHLFGNADNNKVYDGRLAVMERSSETTDQPVVAQPPTVELVQRIVGATADGAFGPNTRKKTKKYLEDVGVSVPEEATDEQLMDLVVNRPVEAVKETVKQELPSSIANEVEDTKAETKEDVNLAIFDATSFSGEIPTPSKGEDPIKWIAENTYGLNENDDTFRKAMRSITNVDPKKTPWCAAFAGYVLKGLGANLPKRAIENPNLAFNYINLGEDVYNHNPTTGKTYTGSLDAVKPGDVIVFNNSARGKDGAIKYGSGHISFVVGTEEDGSIIALGGNQGGGKEVTTTRYTPDIVKEFYKGGFTVRRINDVSLEQTSPEVIAAVTKDISEGGAER